MRFQTSIDIEAPQQRVWDIVSDITAWPQRTETVAAVDVLTPAPIGKGSRVRLRQPKLPEATWTVTTWDAPAYFDWIQRSGGVTIIAGHRVEAIDARRARLTLTIEMLGLLVPIMGLFYRDLTNRYLRIEAEGMKRAAEAP